ncbi:ORF19 [Haliotid herpesvirus 1]|uniref:Ribonucleoside-diphosphate reductase n=1 Tax=Abalone herpesvirus Taiwan/2005 TaxID=1821058 RepID=A0A145VUW5_9VIRU|nr:putative ribonucleotide reductase large subunit RNR1 [Abalone herpesvirus Taiwan/2005]UCX57009.1 ORF19 [Haliotid herpesvirus 1]
MSTSCRMVLKDMFGVPASAPSTRQEMREFLFTLCEGRVSSKTGFRIPFLGGVVVDKLMNKHSMEKDIINTFTSFIPLHSDYAFLAGRVMSALHNMKTPESFGKAMRRYHEAAKARYPDSTKVGVPAIINFLARHEEDCNSWIDEVRDLSHSFMGVRGTIKGKCLKLHNGEQIERISYMFMRVAIALTEDACRNPQRVREIYHKLSGHNLSMASPFLYNAGKALSNTGSCYLLNMGDSVNEIGLCTNQMTSLMGMNGGIGFNIAMRGGGTQVGVSGKSKSIASKLGMINEIPLAFFQGEMSRPGAVASYLPLWHPDFMMWLMSRYTLIGSEENKFHNLFMGVLIPDLFYLRDLAEGGTWSFICPTKARGLEQTYGEEFEKLYEELENDPSVPKTTVNASDLMNKIVNVMKGTGMPYTMNRDPINERSNHSHLGVINSSNLCSEIFQYTSSNEIAICNLATVCVNSFFIPNTEGMPWRQRVNWNEVAECAGTCVEVLNVAIDNQNYNKENPAFLRKDPDGEIELHGERYDEKNNILSYSNLTHRPIGVGQQGLQDLLFMLGIPYDSPTAVQLTKLVGEAIYFGCVRKSVELAKEKGPYPSYRFENNKHRAGILQFDQIRGFDRKIHLSHDFFDWKAVLLDFKKHGIYNSMLTAQPPTASSSQLYDNVESIEAIHSNRFTRVINDAEAFVIINKHLQRDLEKRGLWNAEVIRALEEHNGSVQKLTKLVPEDLRDLYKVSHEVNPMYIAAALQPYIDQGISLNHSLPLDKAGDNTPATTYIWRNMHLGNKLRMKNGSYYIRSQQSTKSGSFGKTVIDADAIGYASCCSA